MKKSSGINSFNVHNWRVQQFEEDLLSLVDLTLDLHRKYGLDTKEWFEESVVRLKAVSN